VWHVVGRRAVSFGAVLGVISFAASSFPLVAQTSHPATQKSEAARPPISKDQAKELFHSVDEILGFVSTDSKLPIQHSVKRKLLSRDEVTKYLKRKFDEDEGARRLERSELVLKKFGLLDRQFDLRPFLISLLTEQIAGFYDNTTKTVNLLDWIEPEEQKPVLAHELTHALQDQKVDLTKWSDVSRTGISRDVQDDNRHLQVDEADTARSAVAEGQAMAVFLDYTLRSTGRTVADSPELVDRLRQADASMSGSPVLARAPLLLQQSLLFPYSEGLAFEQAVLIKAGKDAAFAGVLANPPSSSFEIMNPEAYLVHTPVPSIHLPDLHPLLDATYTPYDLGVMGELDVSILTELFGGQEMSKALAPAWSGGIYYAAQRRPATAPAERLSTASLGLLYYSRWKNADSARSFLKIYAEQLPRKYSKLERRENLEKDGEQIYSTEEGDVILSIAGDSVFVSESFDLSLARQLREAIAAAQPVGPTLSAEQQHEPAIDLQRILWMAGPPRGLSFGRYTRDEAAAFVSALQNP
jgi:hypothetical protein